jgi:hypothetical protein
MYVTAVKNENENPDWYLQTPNIRKHVRWCSYLVLNLSSSLRNIRLIRLKKPKAYNN